MCTISIFRINILYCVLHFPQAISNSKGTIFIQKSKLNKILGLYIFFKKIRKNRTASRMEYVTCLEHFMKAEGQNFDLWIEKKWIYIEWTFAPICWPWSSKRNIMEKLLKFNYLLNLFFLQFWKFKFERGLFVKVSARA